MPTKTTELRKRYYEDFRFYAPRCLKIRPKAPKPGQAVIPLRLNTAQRIFMDTIDRCLDTEGRVRVVVLKGRQQGLSTLIEGLLYWYISQRKGMRGMVVAHKADATNTLFTMTRRYHDNCPEVLTPKTQYSSRKELVFNELDSSITVGTAGADGLGRSETAQFIHASELAFWPSMKAAEIWSGLMDICPPADETYAIVESTAFGSSGVFWDVWQKAKAGVNGFTPVFIPWIVQEEYATPPPKDFQRTVEEEDYVEKAEEAYKDEWWYKPIDDAQLYWRRVKIGEKGATKFQQEYPLTDKEAFISSGMQAFAPEHVGKLRAGIKNVLSTKVLVGDHWEETRSGPLRIFKPIEPMAQYVIGVDVGHGVSTSRKNADWSVAQVLDASAEQVAILRARVLPGDFARWLYFLGQFFNDAEIIVENNGPGYFVCQRLYRDYDYSNFYVEEVFDKITEQYTRRLGFTTSVKTKPLILNRLRDAVSHSKIVVNDRTTLEEMQSFIITETGKYEADAGSFDDTIIALALALHIHNVLTPAPAPVETWDPERVQGGGVDGDIFDDVSSQTEAPDYHTAMFGGYDGAATEFDGMGQY